MKPDKIFGFVFFQQKYDAVVMRDEALILKEYKKLVAEHCIKLKQSYNPIDFKHWNTQIRPKDEAEFDEENKETKMKEIREKAVKKQLLDDIMPTIDDARKMYAFFVDFLCKNIQDVTIMCPLKDVNKIFKNRTKHYESRNLF